MAYTIVSKCYNLFAGQTSQWLSSRVNLEGNKILEKEVTKKGYFGYGYN